MDLYQLLSQSRSADIYNLMSDFIIPIYKCLYDVPMHYFTMLDIFLEYRDIFTRRLDIFFTLCSLSPGLEKVTMPRPEMSMRAGV